jgi:hypothetical protein
MRLLRLLTFLVFLASRSEGLLALPRPHNVSLGLLNQVTSFPISGYPQLFRQYHPGIQGSLGWNWKHKTRMSWVQEAHLGYQYHRHVQHGISLYSSFGPKWRFGNWNAGIALAAGYWHSIPADGVYRSNGDGTFDRTQRFGRPQMVGGFQLQAGYTTKGLTQWFCRLESLLQTPFVPGYVPVLPLNRLHAGIRIPMHVQPRPLINPIF